MMFMCGFLPARFRTITYIQQGGSARDVERFAAARSLWFAAHGQARHHRPKLPVYVPPVSMEEAQGSLLIITQRAPMPSELYGIIMSFRIPRARYSR